MLRCTVVMTEHQRLMIGCFSEGRQTTSGVVMNEEENSSLQFQ